MVVGKTFGENRPDGDDGVEHSGAGEGVEGAVGGEGDEGVAVGVVGLGAVEKLGLEGGFSGSVGRVRVGCAEEVEDVSGGVELAGGAEVIDGFRGGDLVGRLGHHGFRCEGEENGG